MRAASSRLFAGGTALSWSPQITRVVRRCSRERDAGPRDGSDLPEHAQRMRSRPPCFAIWRHQDLGDIAGVAWNRADPTSGRQQHESVHPGGMVDRDLLGDCPAVGVSDDIRFLVSGCRLHRGPGQRYPTTSAPGTARSGLARANPGTVKCNDSPASTRAAKNVQLSIGRDMPSNRPDHPIRCSAPQCIDR